MHAVIPTKSGCRFESCLWSKIRPAEVGRLHFMLIKFRTPLIIFFTLAFPNRLFA